MNLVGVFMLLFNFSLTTPDGDQRQEIINVYSKHFESKTECEEFLENWGWLIRGKGADSLQDMLKEGYTVKLNSVTCSAVPTVNIKIEGAKGKPNPAFDKNNNIRG